MGHNDSIAILGGYAIIHVTKMRSLIAALIMITDTMISAFPKVQLNLFFQSQLSSSLCLSILVGIVYRVHH
jgi:hypothetical protein